MPMAVMESEVEATGPTGAIIDRFGGIRPMATKLAVPVTTVQGWKKRGIIPQIRHADIQAAAARENIAIDPAELAATDPSPFPKAEVRPAAEPMPEPQPEPIVAKPIASEPIVVRRNGPVAYIALVLALLVGVAGTGTGFVFWQYYLQPLRAKVEALEARPSAANTDDLARRIAKLESQSGQPAAAPVAGAPAPGGTDNDRIAALERQLAELKAGSTQTEQLAKGLSDLQVAAGGRELLAQSIRDIQSSVAAAQGEVERRSVSCGTHWQPRSPSPSSWQRSAPWCRAIPT
jgi:type IV secretory pathway VirB10-like protein